MGGPIILEIIKKEIVGFVVSKDKVNRKNSWNPKKFQIGMR